MDNHDAKSLSHSKWRCKYYIIFVQKHHRQFIYRQIYVDIGKITSHHGEPNNSVIGQSFSAFFRVPPQGTCPYRSSKIIHSTGVFDCDINLV